ncbi:hypothetical protein HN954_03140 [bacterium]|jgi:uncharacterized membrane protein|nr:hypothetical protein [bacterium]MBT6832154.1 hypothetical protein [bacterium]MBT6996400.1 hypothetical protein [bacterium]MBT7772135.1 hypothetical protein [bacterium]
MIFLEASPSHWITLFAVFSVTGVLGETMFCAAWKMVHGKPFWTYFVAPIFSGNSSWLNFIPWGIGGFIYLGVYDLILNIGKFSPSFPAILVGGFLGTFFLFPFLFVFFQKKKKIQNAQKIGIILLLALLVLAATDFVLALFLLIGSAVAGILEFLYGKILQKIFHKPFWKYNISARDNGHLSMLAPIGFAIAGIFFLNVFYCFQKLFLFSSFHHF